jgi:hypothetical protein|tara:strand:- start:431 stop:628 length:198 start_codon:yes stop_codon:yes gene_type:complete
MIKLMWDMTKEEGFLIVSKEFSDAYGVLKLDLLQDCLGDLERLYKSVSNEVYSKGQPTNNVRGTK